MQGMLAKDLEVAEGHAVLDSHIGAIAQRAVVSIWNPWRTLWWATIGMKLAADGLAIGPIGVLAFFIGHEIADRGHRAVRLRHHRGHRAKARLRSAATA